MALSLAAVDGEPQEHPNSQWRQLGRAGAINVQARQLLARDGLAVAMLRLDAEATIDEHAAPHEIDVVCLEGEGFISVEDKVYTFQAGQTLTWPAGRLHRLWTAERGMVTLMVERL
jgi:quercetin dioxygenase-like cupin family protein